MNPKPYVRASLALVAALLLGTAVAAGAQSLSGSEPIAEVTPVESRADIVPAVPTPSAAEVDAASAARAAALQAEADREAEVLAYYKRLEDEAAYFAALEEQAYVAALERKAAAETAAAAGATAPTTSAPGAAPAPSTSSQGPGVPNDSYWDRMANCETGGNWAHYPNGRWSGGLGIYSGTWDTWGGNEFAPNAGHATREQQIIVANRIATQGHGNVAPVGYSGWGCVRTVGYP